MRSSDVDSIELYNFYGIKSAKAFKSLYCETLENILVNENQLNQIIAEINLAFNLNMQTF